MSFLLMICLTLVCLPPRYPAPPSWLSLTQGDAAALTLLYVFLIGLHAFWVSRCVSGPLQREPWRRDELLAWYERWRFIHQIFLIGLYFLILLLGGWGWAVREVWNRDGVSLFGTELATLAPFFLAQILGWVFFYDADRAAHLAAYRLLGDESVSFTWLEAQLASSPPFGGRWAYVGFQSRQKFALVFVPVFLVIALMEGERLMGADTKEEWPLVVQGLSLVILVAVLVGWPLMFRFVLGLKPLPPGPLRDRLTAATARLGSRCSDILVWNTRNAMANAMIVGLVPWLRYVIFTDRLLDEFSEDEIEAVFGHEMGHVRHHHMLFYLGFLGVSTLALVMLAYHLFLPWLGSLGAQLANWLPDIVPESLGEWFGPDRYVAPIGVIVVMLVGYLFAVFGFLSRRCERQADIFGCRAVSCENRHCLGHEPATPLAPRGRGLCRTGIHTFIRALDKVALVNGISRDRPGFFQSWQHGSIANRVAVLEEYLHEPLFESHFQTRLSVIKWVLLMGLMVVLGVLIGEFGWVM